MRRRRLSLSWRFFLLFGLIGTPLNFVLLLAESTIHRHMPVLVPTTIYSAYGPSAVTPDEAPLPYEMYWRIEYAQRLVNNLKGVPGGAERAARAVAAKDGLAVRIEGMGASWSTDERMIPVGEAIEKGAAFFPFREYRVASNYIARQDGPVKWVVTFPPGWHRGIWYDRRFLLVISNYLVVTIGLCLVFVFWQLRSLRDLKLAVQEVGRGNFDFQLPIRQESEIGDLARAFNRMTEQVKELLTAKEELLAAVSHELRSPLTRIRLAIAVEGSQGIPRIERYVEQMEKLIRSLLDSSKLESGYTGLKFEELSVRQLLEETAEIFRHFSQPVEITEPDSQLRVSADKERMLQVLANLVENALKYSVDSGKPVVLSAVVTPLGVELQVRDHGPGVPPETLGQIFEPFYRVDKSRDRKTGGYGLGLNLCKKIVDAHNGSIWAANLPDGGLRVTVLLQMKSVASGA